MSASEKLIQAAAGNAGGGAFENFLFVYSDPIGSNNWITGLFNADISDPSNMSVTKLADIGTLYFGYYVRGMDANSTEDYILLTESQGNKVHSFDFSGTENWSVSTGRNQGVVSIPDNNVAFYTNNGFLYSVNLSTGAARDSITLGAAMSSTHSAAVLFANNTKLLAWKEYNGSANNAAFLDITDPDNLGTATAVTLTDALLTEPNAAAIVWNESGQFFWLSSDTYLQKYTWSGSSLTRTVNYNWSADWGGGDPFSIQYDEDRDLIIAASNDRFNLYDVSSTPSRTDQITFASTTQNMRYDSATQNIYVTGYNASGFQVLSYDASDETNVTIIQTLVVSSTFTRGNDGFGGMALA